VRTRPRRRSVASWLAEALVIAATTGLSVSGNQILKEGQVFVPRGFVMKGLLDNPTVKGACMTNGGGKSADSVFNATSWNKIRDFWHANSVRIHISQSGLLGGGNKDGVGHIIADAMADSYVGYIETKIKAVTDTGLVVILSMQDEALSCGWTDALPTSSTKTAWNRLLSQKGTDSIRNSPHVIVNLYNEPDMLYSSADWNQWRNGGTGPVPVNGCDGTRPCNHGRVPLGHQDLINSIRNMGVTNVIAADGANLGRKFSGMYPNYMLHDASPGRGVVYDIHPFFYTDGPSGWDSRWGFLLNSSGPNVPVFAGAWNFRSSECGTATADMAPDFIDYMKRRGIGITVYAWDARLGQGVVKDWNGNPNLGHCPAPDQQAELPGTVYTSYLDSFS